MHESQTYYQNNLNIFSNGLSLLSVNALEVHGLVHQAGCQIEEMEKIAKNIEVHTKMMNEKTEMSISILQKINDDLSWEKLKLKFTKMKGKIMEIKIFKHLWMN